MVTDNAATSTLLDETAPREGSGLIQPPLGSQPGAASRGSWGVGRLFFRVRVEDGRLFELYYDRAPKDAADRLGCWFLRCELEISAR